MPVATGKILYVLILVAATCCVAVLVITSDFKVPKPKSESEV